MTSPLNLNLKLDAELTTNSNPELAEANPTIPRTQSAVKGVFNSDSDEEVFLSCESYESDDEEYLSPDSSDEEIENGNQCLPLTNPSLLPDEALILVQGYLNPGDRNALANTAHHANRKQFGAAEIGNYFDKFHAEMRLEEVKRRFEEAGRRFKFRDSITLADIRLLRANNPGISSQKAFSIDVSSSDITDDELMFIIERFPNVIKINATNCYALTDAGLAHLAKLQNLTSLDLSGCDQITDAGLAYLANLQNLTSLNLYWCRQITDAGLAHLAKLQNLTSLGLWGCNQITDAGLDYLAKLQNLTSLGLWGCNQITDAGLAYLANLQNLISLNLGECDQFTDAGLAYLADLQNLTSLYLEGCNQITNAGLAHLANLQNLISLGLRWCDQITDAGLAHFGANVIITR